MTGSQATGAARRMRVAVYAIALNEVRHVARFLESCAGADLVVVADTGSTDGTMEALQAGGAVVHSIGIVPWRFDMARNAALALVPTTIDVCIALDIDEVLSPGWRAVFDAQWKPGATRGHYLYAWSHRPDGSPAVEFWSDKIHSRGGHTWRHPCHEALYPDRLTESHVYFKGLRVDHWPDPGKSRGQYLPLLQAAAAEDPHSPRNAYYLGREYAGRKQFAEAEAELLRYLALPGATWAEQNSAAMRLLAKCRTGQGDPAGALDWLRRAAEAAPQRREAWLDLADALYERRDWAGCHAAATRALATPAAPTAVMNDPRTTGAHPHDLASFAAWQLGRREEALRHAEEALSLAPDDARLQANVARIRRLAVGVASGA